MLAFSTTLSAQTTTDRARVDMGPELKSKKSATTLNDIIGYDRSGFYALRAKGSSEYYLEHYSNDMDLILTEKLSCGKTGCATARSL